MVKKTLTLQNKSGLHVRPAGQFVKEANRYRSHITVRFGDNDFNAKSILGVLSACIRSGDSIELRCDGEDEAEALAGMLAAIAAGLGEE